MMSEHITTITISKKVSYLCDGYNLIRLLQDDAHSKSIFVNQLKILQYRVIWNREYLFHNYSDQYPFFLKNIEKNIVNITYRNAMI